MDIWNIDADQILMIQHMFSPFFKRRIVAIFSNERIELCTRGTSNFLEDIDQSLVRPDWKSIGAEKTGQIS